MAIRVLIVDDSRIVRGVLKAVLSHFPEFEVVGEAGDGQRAEQLVKELRPDVVSLDVLMPMMGGIEAIEGIMRDCPTPIVIVAELDSAERGIAMEALARGATRVFVKPPRGFDAAAAQVLAATLRESAALPVARSGVARARAPIVAGRRLLPRMVGIVSSAGGPAVLRAILRKLPRALPCTIAIVQHTTAGSTGPLAQWLSTVTGHPVSLARDGAQLEPGQVVVAPDDAHLMMKAGQMVSLDRGPRVGSHRPSGTLLLKSLAAQFRAQAVGVVVSGMGSDGAEGAAAIEAAGGSVLIEDPATATISGMPSAALARTSGAQVVPAEGLGEALLRLLRKAEP